MMPVPCHARALAIAALLALARAFTAPAFAQGAPGIHEDNSGLNGSLTHDDLQKLGGDKSDANAGLTEGSGTGARQGQGGQRAAAQGAAAVLPGQRRANGGGRHQ